MAQNTTNTSYLRQLDGLRFLAVTMVLIDHWSGDVLQFPISYLGVCMFFVLSGFLITRILLQARQKDENLGLFFLSARSLPKILFGFIALSVGLRLFFYLNGTAWMTPYVLMPTCLDAFGIGGLFAYFYFHRNEAVKKFVTNKVWLLISLVLYIGIVLWGKQFPNGHNIVTVVFLRLFESFFSLFMVGNAVYGFSGVTKSFLENKLTVYLGRISYGIYIYHKFIYNHYHNSPSNPVVKILNKLPVIDENMILKIIFLYAVTVLVSTVSWFLIEKPINKWKDKF
eukprot:gene13636-28956_t